MTKDELISNQQLEIENLRENCRIMYKAIDDINRFLFCIGGPLNDNVLNFTNKQIEYLFNIGYITDDIIDTYHKEYSE